MDSGTFDVAIETELTAREETPDELTSEADAGRAGGAVGGTPANKRAVGGKIGSGESR